MEQQMTKWRALRLVAGISQREAERRMGWKSGHLSWIERGVVPTPEQEAALRRLYAGLLVTEGPTPEPAA